MKVPLRGRLGIVFADADLDQDRVYGPDDPVTDAIVQAFRGRSITAVPGSLQLMSGTGGLMLVISGWSFYEDPVIATNTRIKVDKIEPWLVNGPGAEVSIHNCSFHSKTDSGPIFAFFATDHL